MRIDTGKDIAAFAAVAAVRAAQGNKLFPVKTTTPLPAVAGFRPYPNSIDKCHKPIILNENK
jgi:hypothetical protein